MLKNHLIDMIKKNFLIYNIYLIKIILKMKIVVLLVEEIDKFLKMIAFVNYHTLTMEKVNFVSYNNV
jgi:hypothetical protein